MARPEARTCLFCFQPLTHLHGSLGATVSCPTCTGLYEFEVYSKAGPPRETGGGDEWRRCDSCQRMFRGGMPSLSLLCAICRVRAQYDFAAGSYASSKDPRRRSGRKKKLTALPDVRQSSPEEVEAPQDEDHTIRSFTRCPLSHCSKFCYEKKGRGERCVLCVRHPGVELWWWCNGSVIHQGEENRVEFHLCEQTAGIYLCFKKRMDELLLVHVVSIEEEGPRPQPVGKNQLTTGPRPLPLGEDQLFLPCDLECLSDACTDNNPVVCHYCASRGTIFLGPTFTMSSPIYGQTVTLDARVCEQEMNKFDFVWNCNGEDLSSDNHLSCTFQATRRCSYICLALNPSNKSDIQYGVVFMVTPTGDPSFLDPLTDPTVRTEVAPSQNHRVPSHPFPLQLACTSAPPTSQLLTPSIPSATSTPFGESEQGSPSTVLSPVFQTYQPVLVLHTEAPSAGCIQRHPPQSVHDSEPEPMPSAEPHNVDSFLTNELVRSNAFRDPHFNLSSLACSSSCSGSIRDIIQMVKKNFPYSSAQQTLERMIRVICQETTMDFISICRCTVLAYQLILSLLEDDRNPYHQGLGAQLMQRAPFLPMLLKWKPGQSQCLPRGEFVTLSVTAVNAFKCEWICNGVTVRCDADYCFRVDPSTCGVYKCLVHNRHGTVETPPICISMSDEPTSSSVTEAWCETTYGVSIIPGPSTEVARVEADQRTVYGSHAELVVGNIRQSRSETDQVVPSLQSGDDSRGLMMPPSRRDLSAFHHLMPGPRGRAPVGPRLPHVHGSASYSEYRPPPYSRPH